MKKLLLLSMLLCACTLPGYDVKNPALNKVKFLTTPKQKPVTLVKDGKLQFAIVVDTSSERKKLHKYFWIIPNAAKTLADNLEKCFGVRPEILEYSNTAALQKYPCRIYVGQSPVTVKYGIKPETAGREGFIVTTVPDGVAIVGNDSSLDPEFRKNPRRVRKATLWGVYDFLERFCGCRFYFPGEMGSLHPKIANLKISPVAYTDKPYFMNRTEEHVIWSLWGKGRAQWEKMLGPINEVRFFESWRLARTSEFWAGHNPRPERILKAYPDKKEMIFYRAPNGNQYYNPTQHIGNYFDFTNLDLADLFVESLKKYYNSNGKINEGWVCLSPEFVPVGQCDSEVPLPDMINNPTVVKERLIPKALLERGKSYYSDIYARFYGHIAKRLKKELPGKKLVILPYSLYTQPPVDPRWTFPDNVEVRLCSGALPAYTRNKKKMDALKKSMNGWYKALGNRPVISLWLYNVPKNPFARAVVPQYICDIPKIFGKTLGNTELFFDQYGGLEYFYYYANYAGFRGMWNPDFDYKAAIEEHWIPFYGKEAGPELRAFHKLLNECYEKFHLPQDDRQPLYPIAYLNKMEAHLKKAQQVVKPGSIEAKRVAFFLTPWKDAIASQRNRQSYNRPIYGVHQLLSSEKVTIDGKMDEPFWKKVKVIPMIDPAGSGNPRKNPPEIRLAWDKTGIYGILRGNWKPKCDDPSIWKNCNVEFFFSPGVKREQYFQYVIDARGVTWKAQKEELPVGKPRNDKWPFPNFKHKVIRTDKDWTLEFYISFADMKVKPPKAYQSWIMNLISNKVAETPEYSATALTMNNNHDLDLHGFIKFLGKGE